MTPDAATRETCKRCGVPDPEIDHAAKHGGVGVGPDGYCLACRDYREERNREALRHVLARRQGQTATQQSLEDYTP